MKVIPAIDLLNGKVVRLHKGSYQEVTVYNESVDAEARKFKEAGFDHIHIIDLNGAKEGTFVNLGYIRKVIEETGLSVQTGGGIRTFDDVEQLLNAGLQKVICSSMAIRNEADWIRALRTYPEQMILGMDLRDGKIAYSGWLETAEEDAFTFLSRMTDQGLQEVLCTDISRDGTLIGPNVKLYREIKSNFPDLRVIASGGVANAEDLKQLKAAKADAVVVGKAYYEGHLSLEEMKKI